MNKQVGWAEFFINYTLFIKKFEGKNSKLDKQGKQPLLDKVQKPEIDLKTSKHKMTQVSKHKQFMFENLTTCVSKSTLLCIENSEETTKVVTK